MTDIENIKRTLKGGGAMNEVNTWQDYFNLTKQMREMQKKYFKTRNYTVLEESKRLENEVDRAIKKIETTQIENAEKQEPRLF